MLAAAGLLVGVVVATASVLTGASLCEAGGTGVECYELTRTLAIRTGIVAGVVTVLMGLLVAGLARMLAQDEKQRAERAMEAYRRQRRSDPQGEGSSGHA